MLTCASRDQLGLEWDIVVDSNVSIVDLLVGYSQVDCNFCVFAHHFAVVARGRQGTVNNRRLSLPQINNARLPAIEDHPNSDSYFDLNDSLDSQRWILISMSR